SFFFSSGSRHTSFDCDWSSDVCSSDLLDVERPKRLSEPGAPEIPITVVPLSGRFPLGPFDIELVSMAHSIPESNGLIIRTRHGEIGRASCRESKKITTLAALTLK